MARCLPLQLVDLNSTVFNFSPVDLRNPDFERFPLLALARGTNITLDEGSSLTLLRERFFLPPSL